MRWLRVAPLQTVDGLLLTGGDARDRLAQALAGKPRAIRMLPFASGAGWAALFARPLEPDGEPVLPRIADAMPLYRATDGWWFPVGWALNVPAHALGEVLAHLAAAHDLALPAIAVPRAPDDAECGACDLYPIRHTAGLAS
ncbi:hypothetical protein [Novosphingobium terrae]|uniref:hypothetical protein n=1 Tax=Novosphingobium terrae TaxID=2726189 RepID=UPI00197CF3B6|nr:hypothetical protein [Novosphingobium terrae]